MPRVNRNYEREDFSSLLTELQKAEHKSPVPRLILASPPEEVSDARRRRTSLMDKRDLRIVFSRIDKIQHDRTCSLVKKISDDDFDMQSRFSTEMPYCPVCYRKALIRNAIHVDDMKMVDAYFNFFNRIRAHKNELRRLLINHNAQLSNIQRDSVTIKVNEDSWLIRRTEQGELLLLHNNYEVIDESTRRFKEGFHLQFDFGDPSFHNLVSIMVGYTWENHLKGQARAEAAKLLAAKQEELRTRLMPIKNYMKLKKASLFSQFFAVIDCNDQLVNMAKNQKLPLFVVTKTALGSDDSPYALIICEIPRWKDKSELLVAIEELKEYSVIEDYDDYANYCLKQIKQ